MKAEPDLEFLTFDEEKGSTKFIYRGVYCKVQTFSI